MSGRPWWEQNIHPKHTLCKFTGNICSYEKCPRAGSYSLWLREVFEKCIAKVVK